jgi:hypothetical protein
MDLEEGLESLVLTDFKPSDLKDPENYPKIFKKLIPSVNYNLLEVK